MGDTTEELQAVAKSLQAWLNALSPAAIRDRLARHEIESRLRDMPANKDVKEQVRTELVQIFRELEENNAD